MVKKFSYFPVAYFQGKFVPIEKAKISIMTNALQYGTAVFGGIRGYQIKGKSAISLFRLRDHFRRLVNATKILAIPSPLTADKMVKLAVSLVKRNKPQTDVYIRPLIYTSSYHLSPNLNPKAAKFDFAMYMIPLGEYLDVNKGLNVCISSWTRINDNVIPARGKITGGYINSSLARYEAEMNGCDEAILLDKNGHVSEGSGENLFIVRNGVLITSPVYADILEGITRSSILTIAQDLGIPTMERQIDRTEIYIADEVFFTGTGVQVAWIKSIDRRIIGNGKIGPLSKKLQKTFFDVVKGKTAKYDQWRVIVKV